VDSSGRAPITSSRFRVLMAAVDSLPFQKMAEDLAQLLNPCRAERTREAILIIGEPEEIGPVVLVTPEAVEFRLPVVRWLGPHTPVPTSVLWRRVDLDEVAVGDLAKLITDARRARKRQFRTCRYCGRRTPPEHRHEKDVCHGCAEQHLGVVH
jgi:hypothetical protein